MKSYITLLTLSLIVFILCATVLPQTFHAQAHGGRNHECEDGRDVSTGDENHMYYEANTGEAIAGVCIKAGNTPFGDGHSDVLTSDGLYECYKVEGIGTSRVDVTRNNNTRFCQGLSHIDVYTQSVIPTPTSHDPQSPTPTDPPQLTPTPTESGHTASVTPTPTETCDNWYYDENGVSICIHCPGGGECEINIGNLTPTKTPTPTQTPTPSYSNTPTPTMSQTNGTDNSETKDSSNNVSDSQGGGIGGENAGFSGEVLGASTLADTAGTLPVDFQQLLLVFGFLCIGASTAIKLENK